MPLRMRLITLVGLVLLVSLACGAALVGWHAGKSVQTELRAALNVAENTIHNGIDELAHTDDRAGQLRHLIATFNGNRHVRATLLDDRDHVIARSDLLVPAQRAPDWFRELVGGDPGLVYLPVQPPGEIAAVIVLQADPTNEVGEVWGESRDAVLILAGFALLSILLIHVAVGHALRPLVHLSDAFARVSGGDYGGRIPERGPPELLRLADGFNLMTRQLAVVAAQNSRLTDRLLTLQAEERADLARDLHDEIGPLLFAADMTAATIEHLAASGRAADIPRHVRSIHESIGRMQRYVRAILQRLRPLQTSGLEAAINRLAAFWRSRRPDIDFAVTMAVEEDLISDDVKETVYRIIQEGTSNAIRHGRPARVEIVVAHDAADGIHVEVRDDGIGMPVDAIVERGAAQLGLTGMRERVMAMAGALSIQHGRNGKGLALVARLPCVNAPQPQEEADHDESALGGRSCDRPFRFA